MSISETFSPHHKVHIKLTGQRIAFHRFTMDAWGNLAAQLEAEWMASENVHINQDIGTLPPAERQALRMRAQLYKVRMQDLFKLSETPGGIKSMLVFAAKAAGESDDDIAKALASIAPYEQWEIAREISMRPIVPSEETNSDPNQPGTEAADATGQTQTPPNPTGDDSPPSSAPASPDSTPAS